MSGESEFDLAELTKLIEGVTTGGERGRSREGLVSMLTSFASDSIRAFALTGLSALDLTHATTAAVPPEVKFDILKEALRRAVQIEFATIPLYLTALWSIIDQAHPVARSIRHVAHEEMLHLSLLCNLLSALGERPKLTGAMVPTFPGRFPGNVHPDLEFRLEGYSPKALETFMKIERPEHPIPIQGESPEVFPAPNHTIGRFYEQVRTLFNQISPDLDPNRQIAGPFSWFVMSRPAHVNKALELIMAQGEGARGVPFARYDKYLSHYYRFKSLLMLTELRWDRNAKQLRKGKPIPPPSVYTLAPASPDGYGLAAPRELHRASDKFERTYSQMLRSLEESWLEGGHKSFVRSIELMFELGTLAQSMMRMSTPDGRGYCPSFRYRP